MDSQSITSEVGFRHNMDGASANLKQLTNGLERAFNRKCHCLALIGVITEVNSVIFPNTRGILKRAS